MQTLEKTVLDDYSEFVSRRQSAFIGKLSDPNYTDPVLGTRKFTNVQRIFDRVSQYQVREVLYSGIQSADELLLRVFIFNQFKTIAFWEYLKESEFDFSIKGFSPSRLSYLVWEYQEQKRSPVLFTSAYVVPGKSGESKATTISRRGSILIKNLDLFKRAIESGDSLNLFKALLLIPGIGDFLASQVVFDLLWHDQFRNFKPLYKLGVGAKRGAFKLGLVSRPDKVSDLEAGYALETALATVKVSNYPHATANGLPIYLNFADVQNTFCETDKWFRLIHPEISCGKSAPTNIKNKYTPRPQINYCVPGWWVGSDKALIGLDII